MSFLKTLVLGGRRVRHAWESMWNRIWFALYRVEYAGGFGEVNGILTIRRSTAGSISIGSGLRANSGKAYNIIDSGAARTVLRTIGSGRIAIGERAGISNSAIVSAVSVTIGDDVMIGGGCRIWDTDFHPVDFDERRASSENGGACAPIVIEDGAFIGASSIILKGVTIGKRAVIGAGSVVTKDVPAGEVWAGAPARRIREAAAE